MRTRLLSLWLPLAAAFFLFTSPASAYTVTLNALGSSSLRTHANDGWYAYAQEIVYPSALPYAYTSSSVDSSGLDGDASSVSEYDLSNAGFNITFDHVHAGFGSLVNAFSDGSISFSVDQDINYTAGGSYSLVDPVGLEVRLSANVYDHTLGSYVFDSYQESRSTPNEIFTLGGAGGDYSNTNTGSLTGTLIAGHDYSFEYIAQVQEFPSASNATALGSISLSFIPEPSTALLVAFGLAGLALRQRR